MGCELDLFGSEHTSCGTLWTWE